MHRRGSAAGGGAAAAGAGDDDAGDLATKMAAVSLGTAAAGTPGSGESDAQGDTGENVHLSGDDEAGDDGEGEA